MHRVHLILEIGIVELVGTLARAHIEIPCSDDAVSSLSLGFTMKSSRSYRAIEGAGSRGIYSKRVDAKTVTCSRSLWTRQWDRVSHKKPAHGDRRPPFFSVEGPGPG